MDKRFGSGHGVRRAICTAGIGFALLCWPSWVPARQVLQLGGTGGLPWASRGQLTFADAARVPGSIRPMETELGTNLVLSRADRDGDIHSTPDTYTLPATWFAAKDQMADGDSATAFVHPPRIDFFRPGFFYSVAIFVDLGAPFPVERIRFATRPDHPENLVRQYDLYLNDGAAGSQTAFGDPIWTLLRRESDNLQRVVDLYLPPQFVRHLYLHPGLWGTGGNDTGPNETWEIAELEVYGRGFVPTAEFISDPIDLGSPAAMGELRWNGYRAPAAKLVVQTRSGRDNDPVVYWRRTGVGEQLSATDTRGRPLTREAYLALSPAMRAGVTEDQQNWSSWQTYDFEEGLAGMRILSPSPRQYVQFRLQFESTGTDGGQIDSLRLEYSQPPVADAVVGEIWPDLVKLGAPVHFTYALRAQMRAGQAGFTELEVRTSAAVDSVLAVRLDGEAVPFTAWIERGTLNLIRLALPRVNRDQSLVEVDLSARVYRYGTPFSGAVRDTDTDEVALEVTAGDAVAVHTGDQLRVRTSLGGRVLGEVEVTPKAFTPNGDGINDEVSFLYALLSLTGTAQTAVAVYELGGDKVWEWRQPGAGGSVVTVTWDGRDGAGRSVPPGLYIYRVTVTSDTGEEASTGHLAVVY